MMGRIGSRMPVNLVRGSGSKGQMNEWNKVCVVTVFWMGLWCHQSLWGIFCPIYFIIGFGMAWYLTWQFYSHHLYNNSSIQLASRNCFFYKRDCQRVDTGQPLNRLRSFIRLNMAKRTINSMFLNWKIRIINTYWKIFITFQRCPLFFQWEGRGWGGSETHVCHFGMNYNKNSGQYLLFLHKSSAKRSLTAFRGGVFFLLEICWTLCVELGITVGAGIHALSVVRWNLDFFGQLWHCIKIKGVRAHASLTLQRQKCPPPGSVHDIGNCKISPEGWCNWLCM